MSPVRRLARSLGYELLPLAKARDPIRRLVNLLERRSVELVVDGGANEGQYVRQLRAAGWRGSVLSIEPIPELHARLVRQAARDPAWRIGPPVALGAASGRARLEVSAESDMSSLLPRSARLDQISPSSRPCRTIEVPVRRLDELAELQTEPPKRLFVKLDLQGSEAAALDGLSGLLPRIVGLQLELALVPLYVGEIGWRQMIDRLAGLGYVPWLFLPGYVDPKSGRELQMDGVFLEEEADSGDGEG